LYSHSPAGVPGALSRSKYQLFGVLDCIFGCQCEICALGTKSLIVYLRGSKDYTRAHSKHTSEKLYRSKNVRM
jgi:hypothetical protein